MQGYINTTAGLRPLLLEGIEAVTYTQYSTPNQQHGILALRYVPNTGIGGGNIYVWIPYYTDVQFPVEKFWDWVGDVSTGAIGKTLNNYYDNNPFVAMQTSSQAADYSQSQAYVFKLADDATVDDACNHAFETADVSASGLNTFVNVVTNNAANSNPNIGDKIYTSTNQGYDPYGGAFEKGSPGNIPSPNNPTLLDGTYSYLANGHPSFDGEKGAEPQTGTVWRIKIKSGFISEALLCPVDFTALGGVSDIDGFIFAVTDQMSFDMNRALYMCWDKALVDLTNINEQQAGGKWLSVKFGFLLFPNSAPQDNSLPPSGQYSCNYNFGKGGGANIPASPEVFMFDPTENAYKKLQSGNSWTINNQGGGPPVPEVWDFTDFGYEGYLSGPSIVLPPQQYYGTPADPDYSFEYNWGSNYPDEKGADLVCTYFVSGGLNNPFDPSIPFSTYENLVVNSSGVGAEIYFACGALLS